jgi:hypothetical protein
MLIFRLILIYCVVLWRMQSKKLMLGDLTQVPCMQLSSMTRMYEVMEKKLYERVLRLGMIEVSFKSRCRRLMGLAQTEFY